MNIPIQVSKINFTLIGPPGSGKGTYGKMAAAALKAMFLSTGDLLRKGGKVRSYQDRGELVPDALVEETVLDHLSQWHIQNQDSRGTISSSSVGYILDGFPRTVRQAQASLQQWPDELKSHFAISIEVPDEICLGKILGRRYCMKCEQSFNLCDVGDGRIELLHEHERSDYPNQSLLKPDRLVRNHAFRMVPMLPEPTCACDKTNTWSRRADDTPDIVSKRLEDFHQITKPLIRFFEEHGRLIRFVPHQGVDDLPKLMDLIKTKLSLRS